MGDNCSLHQRHHQLFHSGLQIGIALALGALVSIQPAVAQTCSPRELLSIARAGAACALLQAGEVCYGSGAVTTIPASDIADARLAQPGDHAPLREFASIGVVPSSLTEEAPISIVSLAIRTSPRATDLITVLLLQNAELTSQVVPPVELLMTATGTLPVRSAPAADEPLITELAVNNSVIATGRTREGGWLRVTVPATGAVGWVSAHLVSTQGSISSLPVATSSDAAAQPFQIAHFRSGESEACAGSLPAGALLQTPSTDLEDAVSITINSIGLRLAGVVFMRELEDGLTLTVLDGIAEARINMDTQFVPAGAQIIVPLDAGGNAAGTLPDAIPDDTALTAALPTNNLPRRFQVTPSQPQAVIDGAIADLTLPEPTPIPPAPTAVDVCRRSLNRNTLVWSGPGEDFEVLTELEAGTVIRPVRATTDALGAEWWQLANSGWVARSFVTERGNCTGQEVPVVVRVSPPPSNDYSLERCESFNGPVRAGQQVTFEFIPPAWDNYGAARAAVQTDPGHFTINAERYWAAASEPFPLGTNVDPLEDRYLRRFTLVWTAQPGTYRITGDWLTYEPSCNLTVPVE
jgi:uncharacterized protein YgiM (DUF1202 family)